MVSDNRKVCVECGATTPQLYVKYSPTVLKLSQCVNCGNSVDKYVEFDNAIVFLDAVLQKIPAFRHILHNSEFKAFWKLGVFCLICDAYVKWIHTKNNVAVEIESFEIGWGFYLMCLASLFEFSSHALVVVFWSKMFYARTQLNLRSLLDGLVLANFGQLFAVLAVIWGQSRSQTYLLLTSLFVFVSNVQVYRALNMQISLRKSLIAVSTGFLLRSCVSRLIKMDLGSLISIET